MKKYLTSSLAIGLFLGSQLLSQALSINANYYASPNTFAPDSVTTTATTAATSLDPNGFISGTASFTGTLPTSSAVFTFGTDGFVPAGNGVGTKQFVDAPVYHTGDIVTLSLGVTLSNDADTGGPARLTAATNGHLLEITDGSGAVLPGVFVNTSDFAAAGSAPSGATITSTYLQNIPGTTNRTFVYSVSKTFVATADFTGFGFNLLYDYSGGITGVTGNLQVQGVPEPGAAALMTLGGVTFGAGFLRRRFRK